MKGSPDFNSPGSLTTLRRNLEEAVRSFETVLLLDPGNRDAKIYLGACFRDPLIDRTDEARQYYREIIESDFDDDLAKTARKALIDSFYAPMPSMADNAEKARWFAKALQDCTNSSASEFYANEAKGAQVTTENDTGSEVDECTRDIQEGTSIKGGRLRPQLNDFYAYMQSF